MRLLHSSASTMLLPPLFSPEKEAAYGTAKSGVGVASMGVMSSELVLKSIVLVVIARVFLGIYGLIIVVIVSIGTNPKAKSYFLFNGYVHLSSCLACRLSIFLLECLLGLWVMLVSEPNPIDLLLLFLDLKP